jgi:acetyl-CoA carboxylase biotin carboxyl carrier protein
MSSKFQIDGEAIRKLAEILADTDLTEIEYEDDGRRIRVVGRKETTTISTPPAAISPPLTPPPLSSSAEQQLKGPEIHHPNAIKSPMVGTVYVAAEPGVPPFIKVGDTVSVGQTLLIIEAMKVMNPIKAPRAGKITHIFVKDGTPVEFGEPLLVIE